MINDKWTWTGNKIGAEGASKISESLKINTTLTRLYLGGDDIRNKKWKTVKKKWRVNITMNRVWHWSRRSFKDKWIIED